MRPNEARSQPTAETADIDCAAYHYAEGQPLVSTRSEGSRTIFIFRASPEQLATYYGPPGEAARKLLLARRTLLGLVHGGRR